MRKKKRVPFHIKHNLKPYIIVTTGIDIKAVNVTEEDEYDGGKRFYAKNQEEADAYIQRLKEVENKESALT